MDDLKKALSDPLIVCLILIFLVYFIVATLRNKTGDLVCEPYSAVTIFDHNDVDYVVCSNFEVRKL